MSHQAKVFASVQSFGRAQNGDAVFNVEWISLVGPRRQGKESLVIDDVRNAEQLTRDMQQALAARLSDKYAPEVFRARDIAGCTA